MFSARCRGFFCALRLLRFESDKRDERREQLTVFARCVISGDEKQKWFIPALAERSRRASRKGKKESKASHVVELCWAQRNTRCQNNNKQSRHHYCAVCIFDFNQMWSASCSVLSENVSPLLRPLMLKHWKSHGKKCFVERAERVRLVQAPVGNFLGLMVRVEKWKFSWDYLLLGECRRNELSNDLISEVFSQWFLGLLRLHSSSHLHHHR